VGMNELRKRLEREVLPLVSRPSRYIGEERNVPRKDPGDVRLRFLLAFPDVYEIGMSHLGIRVLYDILNRRADVAAERTFAPWIDMEALMRERELPLFSLETHTPASEFDVLGFTLQYELHYTNILNMLDLGGVPLRSRDRGVGDPLVVGGGPCAFNPEPMAEFFDLFVVGDGEGAVLDLVDLVIEGRGISRPELLARAARIPGVYVPSLYRSVEVAGGAAPGAAAPGAAVPGAVATGGPTTAGLQYVEPVDDRAPALVSRRVEPVLDASSHPSRPIVALTETTHDRLAVEIMRGCTRGCRFCHAGMVTRPVRMRPIDDLVDLVERGIACSGYDEVSLVSLSASDYEGLPDLVSRLNERLFDRRVSVSLPSLRADRFGLDVAGGIGRVRKAGLTFAPEAGTQRLRDVINKNETEDSIVETVGVAFASGWNRVKLYFMIGLPTETDDDLKGIVRLIATIRAKARERKKGARINVSISPFVPKPHTPFQWERQDAIGETRRKERLLRERLRLKGVKVALRDPNVPFLEGVMARGDRAVAAAVEAAWRAGARFDGWTETFDFDIWQRAFRETGVDPERYLGPIDLDARLPWEHIEGGAKREFLLEEREKALKGELTEDCREVGCFGCGACDGEGRVTVPMPERARADGLEPTPAVAFGRRERRGGRSGNGNGERFRVRYSKGLEVRFLSHLDIVRILVRALSVSGLPIAYTQGFNPHPKLSFGPPLAVGATGEAEFVDIELVRSIGEEEVASRLASALPDGVEILSMAPLASKLSVSAQAAAAEYVLADIPGFEELAADEIRKRIEEARRTTSARFRRGEKIRDVNPSEEILELGLIEGGARAVRAVLAVGEKGAMRPVDVVRLLLGDRGEEGPGLSDAPDPGKAPGGGPASPGAPELAHVHRTALLRRRTLGTPGLEPIQ